MRKKQAEAMAPDCELWYVPMTDGYQWREVKVVRGIAVEGDRRSMVYRTSKEAREAKAGGRIEWLKYKA